MDRVLGRCACERPTPVVFEELLGDFADVRERCPALKELLVPDDLWPAFRTWHAAHLDPSWLDNDARHASWFLLALHRGQLNRLTSTIHRFLMDGDRVRPDLTNQYRRDLRERWMLEADPAERHRKSRIYAGRLIELQFAEWLETQGWRVTGLEAMREGADIDATDGDGRSMAFQVKFLGPTDEEFDQNLRSLRGEPAGRSYSVIQPVNYMLFRLFEAATQFDATAVRRTAVAIIDDSVWELGFARPLEHKWIDWSAPTFLTTVDCEPNPFLEKQRLLHADLDDRLGPTLRTLTEVWIMMRASGHSFSRVERIRF